MPRLISDQGRHTNPLVWILAILCAILAIAVIIAGIVVFIIYLIYQPKVPHIKIAYAKLNNLNYDQSGLLEIEMALIVAAENDNKKSTATFSNMSVLIQFHGIDLAELRADPFTVAKNSTFELTYLVRSSPIPLDEEAMDIMDLALKQGTVKFDLNGRARARWRVGIFVSVKYWAHLNCKLLFFWQNGTIVTSDCNYKSD